MNLIILGAPGGGKGTISKKLLKDFTLLHISTGDILRKNILENTDLGKMASSYMNSGKLVPDDLVVSMVLGEKKEGKSVLLDGFPRTITQAESLQKSMKVDAVISLVIPHQTIVDRIANRWVHMPSGRTYAYDYNPPKVIGKDDVTGEPLSQRDDDKPAVVKARLENYEKMTKPLISYYEKIGVPLRHFHGTESDVIYPKVKEFLLTDPHFK
jgi:nucleoside-triphosphate--adenylate kinase